MLTVHIDAYAGEGSSQVARLTLTRQGAAATANDYKVTVTEFEAERQETFTVRHTRNEGALALVQRSLEHYRSAVLHQASPLEALIAEIEDRNGSKLKCERSEENNGWKVEFEHDHTTITAKGFTLEEALVEAITTRALGDSYYYGDLPTQSQEQMNQAFNEWHLLFLGRPAPRPYQGEYAEGWQP